MVPDGAGVDLFEAGTTGASGGATRIGDEKLRLSDLAVDEAVENRGRSRGSGWPRGSGRFDDDGGGQGDGLANPSRRPPRRLSVSAKNEVWWDWEWGWGWGHRSLFSLPPTCAGPQKEQSVGPDQMQIWQLYQFWPNTKDQHDHRCSFKETLKIHCCSYCMWMSLSVPIDLE